MQIAATAINCLVAALIGLVLAWYGRGRFDGLDHRIDRLEDRLEAVRSDLTQVALAVGVRPPAEKPSAKR